MINHSDKIVVAGAGSIGCYVGGCLALAGRNVTLLGRAPLMQAIDQNGLRITDLEGRDRVLQNGAVRASHDAQSAMAEARIVLVAVKSGATDEMAAIIDQYAPADAVVVSLQNGVRNTDRLRNGLKVPRIVLAGMVPFNAVLSSEATPVAAHRATEGDIYIAEGVGGLADVLSVEGCPVRERSDMQSVLWAKLLFNLNNALNALSGIPLAEELADRDWRKILAAQMDEALRAMRAAGIKPAKLAAAPPGLLPTILRLPDWLFRCVARHMLEIDPHARSSTWDDLQKGRPTEIAEFQGAIAELARKSGVDAPLTNRIIALIEEAERAQRGSPALLPEQIVTP